MWGARARERTPWVLPSKGKTDWGADQEKSVTPSFSVILVGKVEG